MKKNLIFGLGVWALCASAQQPFPQPAFKLGEETLLAALKTYTNINDQVTACQELSHVGTAACVPALAAHLRDESPAPLFDAACYALLNIPGKAAEKALEEGLARTQGVRRRALASLIAKRAQSAVPGYPPPVPPAPAPTALQKGDAALLPELFAAAVRRDGGARRALLGFPSSAAETFLFAKLSGSQRAEVRTAIDILAERRAKGTFGAFAKAMRETSDPAVRREYAKSFDTLCGAAEVPALLRLFEAFSQEERLEGSLIRVLAREMAPRAVSVEILSADYGHFESNKLKSVTGMVRALAEAGSRRIAVGNRLAGNGGFPSDPAPGLPKELRVTYRMDGHVRYASAPETGELVLAESVLPEKLANLLYDEQEKARGAYAEALKRVFAALSRRGTLPPAPERFFKPLFDGATLTGWKQEGAFWSVRDGIITGVSTPEAPCKPNHHLVHVARTFGDFELRLSFRLSPQANSGVQLRALPQCVGDNGYQADMNGGGDYVGFLYHPRQHLVGERGACVSLAADGKKTVRRFADKRELQKLYRAGAWNEMRVVCANRRIDVWINGVHTTGVEDAREAFLPARGHVAFQLHQGPPMTVEYRNVRVKE